MIIFDIVACEKRIGYVFNDKMLLRKCFTHSSYVHENGGEDNELLEFFGDAIIEFVVTEYLFNNSYGDEGILTKKRIQTVSKEPLLNAIKKLEIADFIILGKGLNATSHQEKLYSSLYEALVAGIYIDGGMDKAKKFIKRTLIDNIDLRDYEKVSLDYKSKLQEYVQKKKLGSISYMSLSCTGPNHIPTFREAVLLNGNRLAEGIGKSKKLAQAEAAQKALTKLFEGGNKS